MGDAASDVEAETDKAEFIAALRRAVAGGKDGASSDEIEDDLVTKGGSYHEDMNRLRAALAASRLAAAERGDDSSDFFSDEES